MFDTLAVIAYLLGHDPVQSRQLKLQAPPSKQSSVCAQSAKSPALRWKNIPPAADSLALIIKDKSNYEWVAYNLPTDIKGLPLGANFQINPNDEGINSWQQKNYHVSCNGKTVDPVTVELFALDIRFSSEPMTGYLLEEKIKGHVLAEKTIKVRTQ